MAKTLTVQLMEANVRIAQLEARLADADTELTKLMARVVAIETAPHVTTPHIVNKTEPVVTHYRDHQGNYWEKTKVGNQSRARIISTAN